MKQARAGKPESHFGFLFDFAGFSLTPAPPLSAAMNSTPAFSRAARSAAIVDCFASDPFSILVTVLAVTPAFSASSRTPKPSAALAIFI